jgi:two-component system response regulator VicR
MADQAAKVIVIEDDPEMIDLLKLILLRDGYTVEAAQSGREGLELMESFLPDVVLLDLMMADMDGWEVYQHMKANEATKNIPVIIVTAKSQGIDKVLGLHIAKVDDYITKPFTPTDLSSSIRRVLKARSTSGTSAT